jgi:putative flippase GtrA
MVSTGKPNVKKVLPRMVVRGTFPKDSRTSKVVPAGMTTHDLEASGRTTTPAAHDPLRPLVAWLPQPIRFIGVGSLGLVTDFGTFSALIAQFDQPLLVRLVSIGLATLVTWRLNRALTFDSSGRRQHQEAMRYAIVTAFAQGFNYLVFTSLVLTVLAQLPHVALLVGSFSAAFLTYFGHRLFAFAPTAAVLEPAPQPIRSTRRT